ncbi:hypothetical protein T492DRAFT_589626 [Pavlovales sp. CCMP2436]|nr:hypothetical protein T492DRAFT_589626 [Pavlovales sp. CCMP2436]|mmetsp:Transcript_21678/g.55002  ORF Transcript_21678/g.55002 Transcript_21678/m.55002 type:complete len:116 (-) Transcript_21678:396-743(-)|eukprot:CAMPEP_0179877092 /NCGR_PEP_ID=MMETSP0982-20121206/24614_1 /TAXON_ID=483367 /ORGANISM="non described non described, Strain CCMP 2436" /LENGTH=115 /DNA_ID=CAMNT_0021769685 /DNA_START=40 /DNA_END=387 /DNA_ORIENTATION=-
MKLLTHNMLTSPGNARGFPLKIEEATVEEVVTDFNGEFIARMVGKLEWQALLGALRDLGVAHQLPNAVPDNHAEDEAFLKGLHHVLVEIEVMEGQLVCPETNKKFPIKGGIPSMI